MSARAEQAVGNRRIRVWEDDAGYDAISRECAVGSSIVRVLAFKKVI